MAHRFTIQCLNGLKSRLESDFKSVQWDTEKRFQSTGVAWTWVDVDIYGDNAESVIFIEFEMYRRNPEDNAVKLGELLTQRRNAAPFAQKEILVLHVFSPFYEVDPHLRKSNLCEGVMPVKFRALGATYATCRWRLGQFPEVLKACQSTSNADNFSHNTQLDQALDMLAKDLGNMIRDWQNGYSHQRGS